MPTLYPVTLAREAGSYCTNLAAPTVTCRWRERGRESQADKTVSLGERTQPGLKGWKELRLEVGNGTESSAGVQNQQRCGGWRKTSLEEGEESGSLQ